MRVHLTREDLVAIFPPPKSGQRRADWEGYVAAILSDEAQELFGEYDINTPLRLCHLFATWAAETELSIIWESGAYSASSIVRVFGPGRHSAKVGWPEARRIAALPVAERTKVLFERVYGLGNPRKAKELGNRQQGDGWRFRGLGLNQITGRWAHEAAAFEIGCKLDELSKPIHCIHAALIEWERKRCNLYADRDDPVSVRKLINAGSVNVPLSRINGMPNALAGLRRAKRVIGIDDFREDDVPPVKDRAKSAPDRLRQSTEVQAAAVVGTGGGYQVMQEIGVAVAKVSSLEEPLPLFSVLVTSPAFWIGTITIAGAIYWVMRRRSKLYIFGV